MISALREKGNFNKLLGVGLGCGARAEGLVSSQLMAVAKNRQGGGAT